MKKQFILIMTDTHRTDWLSCYGNDQVLTPNFQEFSNSGITFTRAYTCQAVCSPARSAIFTGTYPHSNGMMGNDMYLYENIKTVGERLEDNGIKTAYIGKWHLDGGDYFGKGRCPRGWDPEYWYDMRCYIDELPEEDIPASRSFETIFRPGFSREFTYAHRCAKRAKQFIEKHKDQDFLLVISFDEPHHPSLCPPEYYERYKNYVPEYNRNMEDPLESKPQLQKLWAADPKLGSLNGKNVVEDPEMYRRHLACLSFVDDLLGELIEDIDRNSPDALILFTSDHGDMGTNHRLKGKGAVMYDENVRIPFLVRWTGLEKRGIVSDQPVSHINITPTILEFFDAPSSSYIEGKSILPTLANPRIRGNDYVFMEFNRFQITRDTFGGFQPIRAITDGRYKLIINLLDSDEFYDLRDDPGEMNNIIQSGEHFHIRDALHDKLIQWMNETFDPFRGYHWLARTWRKGVEATWKDTGLARHRWDEPYEEAQRSYQTGLPMSEDREYSQYPSS